MARISLTLAEWQAVARELAAAHNIAAGPGLLERVRSLLEQAPHSWPGQVYALEIDLATGNGTHPATGRGPRGGIGFARVAFP